MTAAHNAQIGYERLYVVRVPLSDQVDIEGFHHEASRLLAQQVAPDAVQWSAEAPVDGDAQHLTGQPNAVIRNRAMRAIVPQSFVRMSELVVLHRDPLRFEMLYRTLWRLVYEPELRHDPADADLARLRQMAQSVRRDLQKMKARMTFAPLRLRGELVDVCWYVPVHFICEDVGGWLSRRDPAARWMLLTPDRSLVWDAERLLAWPAVAPPRPREMPAQEWQALLEAQSWL